MHSLVVLEAILLWIEQFPCARSPAAFAHRLHPPPAARKRCARELEGEEARAACTLCVQLARMRACL
jgi:hypothetical protein